MNSLKSCENPISVTKLFSFNCHERLERPRLGILSRRTAAGIVSQKVPSLN